MRREVKILHKQALDSLILSIEHFNRPDDRGRVSTVLILLDHAFEMLLKASVLHRGGKIRERRARETIGFDACVRRGLSDGAIKFLTDEQALTLQTINGLRDAAQHHFIDISEQQFYLHTQTGVTLFRDLLKAVFNEVLATFLPARVLPVSTAAPVDVSTLFETESAEIKKLLGPRKRKRTEADARLRPLAIFDAAIRGEKLQPSTGELRAKGKALVEGKSWQDVFPGAGSIDLTTDPNAPAISLRITKKEGVPVQLVPEGTPGASVVAIKRVNELDFYNLGRDQLAKAIDLSGPKTTAIIWHLKFQNGDDYFKEIPIGKSKFKRYSQKAITALKDVIKAGLVEQIWDDYWACHSKKKAA
jgi:hypothetical protein